MNPKILLAVLVSFAGGIFLFGAESPKLLPFQGRLTDSTGNAVADGARVVQFKIYDAPVGGQAVWNGEVQKLTVNDGLVNTVLGSKSSLAAVDFNQALYLELTIDANNDGQITVADPPLLPRQSILPAVFAKEAADSRLLDGHDWSSLFAEGATNPASARIAGNRIVGQSLTAAQMAPQTITAAQIAPNTITSSQLAAGIIGATQLASSSVAVNHLTAELIADAIHPPGSVIAWMGANTVPPAGWEFCWGQVVGRTVPQYARLFLVIGTANGAGTNASTFNLPDFRGMFLRGVNGERSDAWRDPDVATRTLLDPLGNTNAVGSLQDSQYTRHHQALPTGEDVAGQTWGSLIGYVANGP